MEWGFRTQNHAAGSRGQAFQVTFPDTGRWEIEQFGGSNCKTIPNLIFPPLISLHDPYSGYHRVPWSPASTPALTVCSPHAARGNLGTPQGPLFFLPTPLRIKCKVFVNTLPALHKCHFQPIPLGTQASNTSYNTTHCFLRAFVRPAPPA